MIKEFKGRYRFLSNFYSALVEYEGIYYPSSEHAFQAAKSLSMDIRRIIANCKTPGDAKVLGRSIPLRRDWEDIKVEVMAEILSIKFKDQDLQQELLDTGDQHLEEGNNHGDTFWGTVNGKGQNQLGILLMELRDVIRDRQRING